MRNLLAKLALLAIFLSSPFALKAQDSSSMTGVVTDATGAAVPGSVVTLANASTGTSFTAKTDDKGSYRFANVPPAAGYVATFIHEGFSSTQVTDITLNVAITRTQNATLHAGTNQQVEVSASASEVTLNTTDASIGNNFDVKLLDELPVQSRLSPAALFSLQPGVAGSSVTGARTDQTSVTVDGMDVNDIAAGSGLSVGVANAPVDSVQEFRGIVAGLPASSGTGSGGQFQLVTRGGTNKFHGNVNEYHRDTSTVANEWFLNNSGIPRTPLIRNQFGGSVGGPILHDKLFFFFNFLNYRTVQSGSTSRTVPLDSFRNGNLNYILATAGGNACPQNARLNTNASCIGTLTSAQVKALDPQGVGFSQNLLAFINGRYPHANDLSLGDGVNTGGYRFTQPTPDTIYNYVGKVDYNLTPSQHIFARFTIERENRVYALNNFPTDPLTSPFVDRSYGYVISHIWQLGNNKVNQFYYGDTISKVSFPNLYNPTGALQFGLGGLTAPYTSGSSQKRRVPIPEFRDDFNVTKGSHNISLGGTFKFIKTNSNLVNDFSSIGVGIGGNTTTLGANTATSKSPLRPADIVNGTTAAGIYDSLFTMALGRLSSIGSNYNYNAQGQAQQQGLGETRNYRYYQTELYLGDTWKVSKALTLTYGLRYQLYSVPYEVHGNESIQNLSFDQLFRARTQAGAVGASGDDAAPLVTYNLGGKANNTYPLYNPSFKDFGPRLALAYNPSWSPKTVFNTSVALIYDRTVINAINFIQDQSSFLFQNSIGHNFGQTNATAALLADPRIGGTSTALALPAGVAPPVAPAIGKPYTPYVDGSTPIGGSDGDGYSEIVDPNLKDPYSIAINAGVQRDLPGHSVLRVSYVGRLGRRLIAQADASQVVDFLDPASGQTFVQAFSAITQQIRAGQTVTAQPWFKNQSPGCASVNCLVGNFGSLFSLGDIADFANALLENGLINNNVTVGAQFALNPWVTNKGSSSYNGLLVSLTKNYSQGVRFDVNYTFSHSIDNVSAPANYIAANSLINFICDANNLRTCRGNSDFDIQHVLNSDFVAELPVGKGKMIAGNANRIVNEFIGGWSFSGTPAWRSGNALGVVSGAFDASFNEDAPPIFNGNRAAVATHVNHNVASKQMRAFTSQSDALSTFTGPIGLTIGSRNNLRGPGGFSMDAGLAKTFPIIGDRLNAKFRADFYNVLNHPIFSSPNADITSTNFGVISSTSSSARVGQFSLRLEF